MSQIPEVTEVPTFSPETEAYLEDIISKFGPEDALLVKEIEKKTNHDVKAVEYVLKEKLKVNAELEKVCKFLVIYHEPKKVKSIDSP